jgi:hypothetical protein
LCDAGYRAAQGGAWEGRWSSRYARCWDFGLLVGYKAVGVTLKSGEKEIGGDLILHGPVLRSGAEF